MDLRFDSFAVSQNMWSKSGNFNGLVDTNSKKGTILRTCICNFYLFKCVFRPKYPSSSPQGHLHSEKDDDFPHQFSKSQQENY